MSVDLGAVYDKHAGRWDRARNRTLVEGASLNAASELAPPPGKVLDLGCGSAEPIARYFIDQGYVLTGVDLADGMLELCRRRFPSMTWLRRDMRGLELGERFDIVVAWDSFFHLGCDDQRAMLETFQRHTAPGGVLLFTSGDEESEGAGGDMFGDQLYHGSLTTEEYRERLEGLGFAVVQHRVNDPACLRTMWLLQLVV